MSGLVKISFEGKTVIVTGASSGLGASLAEAFAVGGANVILFGRTKAGLERVARRCQAVRGEARVVVGDVTVQEDCADLIYRSFEAFGQIDIVVACAGIGMWARFDELPDPGVLKGVMDVNYGGLVNVAFHALPYLRRSGGILVAISSVQGKIGVPYHSGYAASKHAVQGFCDSLRMEIEQTGVDVLTVLPHWIQGTLLRKHALGRDGQAVGDSARDHGSGAVPLEEATRAILKAVARRKRMVFVPGWLRALSWLGELMPSVADRLISRRVDREGERRLRTSENELSE